MRKLVISILMFAVVGSVSVFLVGTELTSPRQRTVGDPPVDLRMQAVVIARAENTPVSGWSIESGKNRGAVLLLHSVRSDRREMIDRAQFLQRAGFSVLLIDMQAHGETPGDHITFGYLESRDAQAALRWLKTRFPAQPIGVIGVSLGGAATLLGDEPLSADAVILEAVYSTIDQAVENRLAIRLGEWGRNLSPLLLWQLEPRLGIPRQAMSPLAKISRLSAPVMIIAGSDDRHTLPYETKALFQNANEPKRLWLIEGATHENLHRFAPEAYEKMVLDFFNKYLTEVAS